MMNNEDKILSILETLVVKVDGLETKVDNLETRFDTLETKVDKIEHDVQDVKHRIIVIEHDYGKRIDAALDGYSALYDISNEIRSDIRKIYSQQDRQDAHITILESERRKSK